jgi:hypothetical protein
MSDNFDDILAPFFDTSDNICENIDWVSSGTQAQILEDFKKPWTNLSAYGQRLPATVQAAANRGLTFRKV